VRARRGLETLPLHGDVLFGCCFVLRLFVMRLVIMVMWIFRLDVLVMVRNSVRVLFGMLASGKSNDRAHLRCRGLPVDRRGLETKMFCGFERNAIEVGADARFDAHARHLSVFSDLNFDGHDDVVLFGFSTGPLRVRLLHDDGRCDLVRKRKTP